MQRASTVNCIRLLFRIQCTSVSREPLKQIEELHVVLLYKFTALCTSLLFKQDWSQFLHFKLNLLFCVFFFKGTQSRFCVRARVWFLFSWSRIQRCDNWYRAFTNPFASSSINFGFALKLLRIKDQWYTVLVKSVNLRVIETFRY